MSKFVLRHYSHRPITEIVDKEQRTLAYKPAGLWLSADGDDFGWPEWCESESFDGGWEYVYRVNMADNANILWLKSAEEVDRFHAKYVAGFRCPYERYVDWHRVAFDYDGLVIAPYRWDRRLNGDASGWYYGWDCASGCVWAASAIKSLTKEEAA